MVDQQMASQVRFILELLDVISVAAGIKPPVNVAGIITESVLTILRKLDREAVIRASVNPFSESLDDYFGAQLQ